MRVGYALYSFFLPTPPHSTLSSSPMVPYLSSFPPIPASPLDKICQLEKEKTARSSSQLESSSAAVENLSPPSQDTRMDLVLDLSQQVECMRRASGSALCVCSVRKSAQYSVC